MLLVSGTFSFSQYYPDYPGDYGGGGYYYDNPEYFSDDYYYEYPADYYNDNVYISFYNDYRKSITKINWNKFYKKHHLTPWQIDQIIRLNQMYADFAAWNMYYRYNPDRWYYDRFFALQFILGPQVFVIFQNTYYGGYSPVVYYHNYRIKHYKPAICVRPYYRNINVNVYRIDRTQYHANNGWYNNYRENIGFKNNNVRSGSSYQNPGFQNNGVRNSTTNNGVRNNTSQTPTRDNNSGVRNNSTTQTPRENNGNVRNNTTQTPKENVRDNNSNTRGGNTRGK